MRLTSIVIDELEQAAVVLPNGLMAVKQINAALKKSWPTDLLRLIEHGLDPQLALDAKQAGDAINPSNVKVAPLYRRPRKIWGIGLNYLDHAKDLNAPYPTAPASFMKNDNTIIGPGDAIQLPPQSERVTAEAELGLIIGKTCRAVSEADAVKYLAGYCLIIDMTAEDILQINPRFLTRSKNFDTFFSFGPELITPDEVPDVLGLTVGTYNNGALHRENQVRNMAFPPDYLVSFHSHVATLYPGDIISTGTPGAVVIKAGDVTECRIGGLGTLSNPVVKRDW
jgi:2-keto-4-pentenoate hydratase/2-oxohepta-3-ene-1,7-dioic acid hydratase in catechol pathway